MAGSMLSIGIDWCTTATSRLTRAASATGSPPHTLSCPPDRVVTPHSSLTSVVLPAPLGPSRPTTSASASVNVTSATAGRLIPLYCLVSDRTTTAPAWLMPVRR